MPILVRKFGPQQDINTHPHSHGSDSTFYPSLFQLGELSESLTSAVKTVSHAVRSHHCQTEREHTIKATVQKQSLRRHMAKHGM